MLLCGADEDQDGIPPGSKINPSDDTGFFRGSMIKNYVLTELKSSEFGEPFYWTSKEEPKSVS